MQKPSWASTVTPIRTKAGKEPGPTKWCVAEKTHNTLNKFHSQHLSYADHSLRFAVSHGKRVR